MIISKSLTILALAFAVLFTGCYSDRLTNNYDDSLFGNIDLDKSNPDEVEISENNERQRIEELKRLANEEKPIYHINPGDKIDVRVYGHDDISTITRVSPDGSIGMVFVGQVMISGLSISEARDAIEKSLMPYVRHPVVGVTVLEVSSETVTISGAAMKPGLYNITSSSRLADIYAQAGGSATRLFNGLVLDVADYEHSLIVRDGRILPVDFKAAIENGDLLNNIKMKKGDYIFIAQRMESSITICGEVHSPHRRPYETGMGLIELLTSAGWMLDTHWSNVIIIRNSLSNPKMYKVNVDKIMSGKGHNIKLEPNDIVYVPKDNMAEYNVFVRKLMPTAQLMNLLSNRKLVQYSP